MALEVPNRISTGLWTPDGAGAHLWNCPFCETTYDERQEPRIMRHIDTHTGEMLAHAEMKRNEPLHQSDHEQLDWLRKDAERRRDKSVKGVT